jgi:hypothetical protein
VSEASALVLRSDALVFFKPAADENGTISDAITFKAWDRTDGSLNGSTGVDTRSSTAFSSSHDTAAITIKAVNDAPGIALLAAPQVTENASAVPFAGKIRIADVDGDAQTVTLTVEGGTVPVDTTDLALDFTAGDGTDDVTMTFKGSLGDVNEALDSLTFTPDLNSSGTASIQVATNDGNMGTNSDTLSFSVLKAPRVLSIVRTDGVGQDTNDASVSYTVTFSEAVTGVDSDDFKPITSIVTGASVTGVTPVMPDASNFSQVWTVTVATGTGDGEIRLDLADDDTIVNTAGVALVGDSTLNGGFEGQSYAIDRSAPLAPVISGISDDTGEVDGITSDTTLVISGTAEANAKVEVFQNGTSLGTVKADVNGSWSLDHTGTTLPQGSSTLTATATDAAGNESNPSEPFQLTVDTAGAQVLSILRQTPSEEATNADTLVYRVTFDEAVLGVTADDFAVSGGSTATVSSVTPVDGSGGTAYDVTVTGGDLAGFNGTVGLEFVSTQNITDVAANALASPIPTAGNESYSLDNTPPAAPTFGIVAGNDIINADEKTSGVILMGTTEAGTTVTLKIGGMDRVATVDTDTGTTWSYTLQEADYTAMAEGAETITVTARDAAGNTSQATRDITVDTVAPSAPTFTPTDDATGVPVGGGPGAHLW